MALLISPSELPANDRGIRRAGSDATLAPNADATACRFIVFAALGLDQGKDRGAMAPAELGQGTIRPSGNRVTDAAADSSPDE